MVQGEINTAVPPTSAVTTAGSSAANGNNINLKLYENVNDAGESEKKKKVGNYIISKTIGEGSFAKVRLGYHLSTQQMVAVKVINKREVLKRNYLRANLRREACMMQRMQHPHIIQLYEVMETENCYYIVMELIDGIEFVKYLSKKRSLDENETRDYIRQIVSAVDHMHKAKIIHRDIKLQNFMLDQNRNITIIDFGLSNSLDDREFLNTQCGSPAYAAPEIFAHQDYGAEVDIWSIGVNMYAMLAGRLPFKVENRSKNLAKLHACILKGFEVPPFLSPDCQDLLCRLLEPSPSKRIKMSEILNHPWLNYNTVPIEIIPYKPFVDIKEVRRDIVQYLVQKHDYTENDVVDAIIHRKPIALKAIYYLIEKRLKQGLSFPDPDYNHLILAYENNPYYTSYTATTASNGNGVPSSAKNGDNHNFRTTFKSSNQSIDGVHHGTSVAQISASTLPGGGLVKQNSQLLPKRHTGVQLAQRSSSQKNIDFKAMFGNMNLSSANGSHHRNSRVLNNYKDSEMNNGAGNSNSPSPDFIAAAMNPIKTAASNGGNHHVTSASSSTRGPSRIGLSSAASNNNGTENGVVTRKLSQSSAHNGNRISYPTSNSQTDNYRSIDHRYYTPSSASSSVQANNRMIDDTNTNGGGGYYQTNERDTAVNYRTSTAGIALKTSHSVAGSIRSLPSSLYRGSPERNMIQQNGGYPIQGSRSPERNMDNNHQRPTSRISSSSRNQNYSSHHSHHHHHQYMPDGSVSTAPTPTSEKSYDLSSSQKLRMANYLASKRSLTACDEPIYAANIVNGTTPKASLTSSQSVKNRQLHMGKAKIDLETQQNMNVGVNLKNIGSYLKSSLVKNLANGLNGHHNTTNTNPSETIKSINLKTSSSSASAYNHHRAMTAANGNGSSSNHHATNESSNNNGSTSNRTRHSMNLVHRHSNPLSSYTNTNVLSGQTGKARLQTAVVGDSAANALPRIRINS